MRTENGNYYYEVGDTLYYTCRDAKNKVYIIERIVVESIENGIPILKSPTCYTQKRLPPQYTPSSNLLLSKEDAYASVEKDNANFNFNIIFI